ncbi:MAG: hypothetical protein ABWY06_22175 [Pseudomonas sp.]|uniref:hypothetical protein n=1 Tax=Pseudomonas sp. TaxID=306 RepID=UPI00339B6EE9
MPINRLAAALLGLFTLSSAQAACDVDLPGTWRVTHTSASTGGPKVAEDMPSEFTFAKNGSLHIQMGLVDVDSRYRCNGKTIVLEKAKPSTLDIVAVDGPRIAWLERGQQRVFHLQRQ